jgi:CheY-like chemotaxis protein
MTDRILVIDDSSTIQKVIQIALEPFNIAVTTANSYLEAISETNRATPDLVIADASLPGIKGADDYAQLQRRLKGVPFIILEGSYEGMDEEAFREHGFRWFLRKPFEAQELLSEVERALQHPIESRQTQQAAGQRVGNGPIPGPPPPPPPPPKAKMKAQSNHDQFAETDDPTKVQTSPPAMSLNLDGFADHDESEFADMQDHGSDDADEAESDISQLSFDFDQGEGDGDLMDQVGFDDDLDEFGKDAETTDLNEAEAREEQQPEFAPQVDTASSIESTPSQGFVPPPPPPVDQYATDKGPGVRDDLTPPPPPPPLRGSAGPKLNDKQEASAAPDAQGLVEPFLREELAQLVKQTVQDYCDRHFSRLARTIITEEIKKLTEDKARLLIDK